MHLGREFSHHQQPRTASLPRECSQSYRLSLRLQQLLERTGSCGPRTVLAKRSGRRRLAFACSASRTGLQRAHQNCQLQAQHVRMLRTERNMHATQGRRVSRKRAREGWCRTRGVEGIRDVHWRSRRQRHVRKHAVGLGEQHAVRILNHCLQRS